MSKQILMITSTFDKTCDYLIKKYPEILFFRFNIDVFSEYKITCDTEGFKIEHNNNKITSSTCLSIYFRKPTMEILDDRFNIKYHQFIHKEVYSIIEGITESFEGKVLTRPSIMRKANNKIVQASLVKKVGFSLPNMAITNNNEILNKFTVTNGIIKPVSVGEITTNDTKEFVQTNKINPSFNTDLFKFSPVYLQDYIEKDYEVRVTVIDNNFFPVKITSTNNIDWRKPNNTVSYSMFDIPNEIKEKCLNYMKLCNMHFGCFDLLIKDSNWYFLEMNANGQWAWLELETGYEISHAIINHLTDV
ncbi:hypothetical protein [Aliivibrio sp. EL58]|uniref:hypothetical protein n=1 Tax=Aliivibrio sp. EL58 TaxID=2107582 RepID=UPI0013C52F23|nr:hypothetical protein [Aliivibrio sp. EL58]